MRVDTEKKMADFTEGSILQSILKMGVPSMIGFLANHIYYMVDMWWLSRLPEQETAVAAVTIFANVAWVFFSFNMLIGTGSVAIISRRYGEKKYDLAETAIKETFILKLVVGLVIGIIGFFLTESILHFAEAKGETFTMAVGYGKIIFIGTAFSFSIYSVYTAMRGVANPNMAMGIMIGSTILNMILDPILIFGYFGFPAMGVNGAAVASVTSYTLTFLIGVVLFYSGATNVRLHFKSKVGMSISTMYQIIKIGIPSWLGSLSYSGSRFVIMPMIAVFGNNVVAAYGVGMQISAVGISLLVGIGLGLSSLIGHNIGALKKERARTTANQSILLAIGIMTAMGLIVAFAAEPIMRLYFDNDLTISYGKDILLIFAIVFPFWGVYIMLEQIHAGVGLNVPAMILNAGNAWLLQIPAIFILTKYFEFDQNAVWWTMMASSAITAFIFYLYYRRGRWLTVKV